VGCANLSPSDLIIDFDEFEVSATSRTLTTDTQDPVMEWEAFFLALGSQVHSSVCVEKESWIAKPQQCSICLVSIPEAPQDVTSDQRGKELPCGHTFHSRCVQMWREQCARDYEMTFSCPLCRHDPVGERERLAKSHPFLQQLSTNMTAAIELVATSPKDPDARTMVLALNAMAADTHTSLVISYAIVPTTLGHATVGDCYITTNRGIGAMLPRMLPSRPSIPLPLQTLLCTLGVQNTTTLAGLLHATGVMRQQLLDGNRPRGGSGATLASFANLYQEILQLADNEADGADVVKQHFEAVPSLYCGGGNFRKASECILKPCPAVTRILDMHSLEDLYGPTLKPFFREILGIKSVSAEDCKDALNKLAGDGRRVALASNPAQIKAVQNDAAELYQVLWGKIRRDPGRFFQLCSTIGLLLHDSDGNQCLRFVPVNRSAPALLKDEEGVLFDACRDKRNLWVDETPFGNVSILLQCLKKFGFVNAISEISCGRSDLNVKEPIVQELQWTLRARAFLHKMGKEHNLQRLCDTLSSEIHVLRAQDLTTTVDIVEAEHAKTVVQCGVCNKMFKSDVTYREHQLRVHPSETSTTHPRFLLLSDPATNNRWRESLSVSCLAKHRGTAGTDLVRIHGETDAGVLVVKSVDNDTKALFQIARTSRNLTMPFDFTETTLECVRTYSYVLDGT
jgi:hypothetical protein